MVFSQTPATTPSPTDPRFLSNLWPDEPATSVAGVPANWGLEMPKDDWSSAPFGGSPMAQAPGMDDLGMGDPVVFHRPSQHAAPSVAPSSDALQPSDAPRPSVLPQHFRRSASQAVDPGLQIDSEIEDKAKTAENAIQVSTNCSALRAIRAQQQTHAALNPGRGGAGCRSWKAAKVVMEKREKAIIAAYKECLKLVPGNDPVFHHWPDLDNLQPGVDGVAFEDFKDVVRVRYAEWYGDDNVAAHMHGEFVIKRLTSQRQHQRNVRGKAASAAEKEQMEETIELFKVYTESLQHEIVDFDAREALSKLEIKDYKAREAAFKLEIDAFKLEIEGFKGAEGGRVRKLPRGV